MTEKLTVIQNRCLRVVAEAYKAVLIEVLHAETMIPPMQEYLDLLQAQACMRLRSGGQSAFIKRQRKKSAAKLCKRGAVFKVNTPGCPQDQWARNITGVADTPPPPDFPPWMGEHVKPSNSYRIMQRHKEKLREKHFAEKWKAAWEAYQRSHPVAA